MKLALQPTPHQLDDCGTLALGDRVSKQPTHGVQSPFSASNRHLENPAFSNLDLPYRLGHSNTGVAWRSLDIREQVLMTALLRQYLRQEFRGNPYSIGTEYEKTPEGRVYNLSAPRPSQLERLIEAFKEDPRSAFATIRRNLIGIANDPLLTEMQAQTRVGNYFDASIRLTLRLDHLAFQRSHDESSVVRGAPPYYLSNGFVDLGKEPGLTPSEREREKITVDKGALFAEARSAILTAIWNGAKMQGGMIEVKREMLRDLSTWIVGKISYGAPEIEAATDPVDQRLGEGIGVCRHYAMTSQLLNQQMGLSSRLIKADFGLSHEKHGEVLGGRGRHAANLVRFEDRVAMLDLTHSTGRAIKLYELDRALNLRSMNIADLPALRFERAGGVTAEYSLKNDGYWTIRSLEKLEARRPQQS